MKGGGGQRQPDTKRRVVNGVNSLRGYVRSVHNKGGIPTEAAGATPRILGLSSL